MWRKRGQHKGVHGCYLSASRQSTAAFILSVAEHYQMWFKWENLYEEVMDSYKKMSSMKKKMNDGEEYDNGEYGFHDDDHYEMNDSPMPNTPLAQFFMENMGNQMGADGHRRSHGNNRPHHGPNRPGGRRPSYEGEYKQNSVKEMAMHMMNQEDMDIDYMMNFGMNMFGKAMEMFNGMDMQTIAPMAMRVVQNTAGLDLSTILEMAKMFM